MTKQRAELTYKHNLKQGRHGWLRLTPAYSIKVVEQILDANPQITRVLDPFSGTGTTGLVCAERGIDSFLLDMNPFLVWLARAKTSNYTPSDLECTIKFARQVSLLIVKQNGHQVHWTPPISNISSWWDELSLISLAEIFDQIHQLIPQPSVVKDLLLVAFCRLTIAVSKAAFNHQSMSFKKDNLQLSLFTDNSLIPNQFFDYASEIAASARNRLTGEVQVLLADSRQLPQETQQAFDCVITSPPYPNRMSYIRELRPYMYWLGYLTSGREAGEMDWRAIGGTWGIATSRLQTWTPSKQIKALSAYEPLFQQVSEQSLILGNYLQKYFEDTTSHLESVYGALQQGGKIFYIIGNSKFYDTLIPVEEIYASLFNEVGFREIEIDILRKRNSKKELLEFIVSAQKPA